MVLAKKKYPPLEYGHFTKIGGMWNLKHEITSQKIYELLIKIELKGDTDLDINKFYNHINICINALNILIEDLILSY